jgi:hypothetical protein
MSQRVAESDRISHRKKNIQIFQEQQEVPILRESDEFMPSGGCYKTCMILVRKWSVEISLNSLENCQASRFYKSMLNNQSGFVQDLRMLSSMRWSGGEALECTRKACKFPSKGWDISRTYDYYTTLNENRLIHMLEILRELRKSIAVAAQSSYIHTELLAKLKMRLQELDRDSLYSLACSYIAWGSIQEPSLVQADSKTWWSDTLANPLEL